MRVFLLALLLFSESRMLAQNGRTVIDFNSDWQFYLFDTAVKNYNPHAVREWRKVNLPHDWSIEGKFSDKHPATIQGGALPGGVGVYRKTFTLPENSQGKNVFIEFDGVYRNSEVFFNGISLGKRPNGYVSFRYDLTPHIKSGSNVLVVKVDNSAQPDSRWYTGSGIYRNVRLVMTNPVAVDYNGTFISASNVSRESATIRAEVNIHLQKPAAVRVQTFVHNSNGKIVAQSESKLVSMQGPFPAYGWNVTVFLDFVIRQPSLWSLENPFLYKAVTKITQDNKVIDQYDTPFGIRYFNFDVQKGFSLNGKPMKILGVCLHHDLGALGAAINVRAMERQLQILKNMGCNAIRTAHNPPAPELLDLCDKMGFIVMDESFDTWKKRKTRFDYHRDFDEWHKRDLEDMIKRDRNHPSIFMWSIGNEIREQFDTTGIRITRELVNIVKLLDTSRPVTAALTETDSTKNFMYQAQALDLIGLNYNHAKYDQLPQLFPNKKIIASETTSGLNSRGYYEMPSDTLFIRPQRGQRFDTSGHPHFSVSSYDNSYAYWGSSHEETWKGVKKHDYIAGLFVWSGFDYLGEPTPYPWPARSSYFGIIDLAGFPKDVYYMYQSEWTNKPVLHLFPHWNWPQASAESQTTTSLPVAASPQATAMPQASVTKPVPTVDVWAYYNNADEAELFLNGRSLGVRKKQNDDLHVQWSVPFEPGTLKAVTRKNGRVQLTKTIKTAGAPARIKLTADRQILHADGKDLAFITVEITDAEGNLVPYANNLVNFSTSGEVTFAGADNGYPADIDPFKIPARRAYKGKCLAILQTTGKPGSFLLTANSPGLVPATIALKSR